MLMKETIEIALEKAVFAALITTNQVGAYESLPFLEEVDRSIKTAFKAI